MSVDNYKYQCDHCGHTENQCEGIFLLSDKCYTTLQCPQCKKVSSILLTENATNTKDYPLCPDCNVRMSEWDKTCPQCGTKMKVTEWITDTI